MGDMFQLLQSRLEKAELNTGTLQLNQQFHCKRAINHKLDLRHIEVVIPLGFPPKLLINVTSRS